MRNYLFLIVIYLFSCSTEKNTPITQNLSDWEFQYNDKWFTSKVPGNNFSDLLSHKIIPNPFYGTNEDSLQWVSEKDWIYKSEFTVSENELKKDNISLSFYGLDTYSEIYLNDNVFGEAGVRYSMSVVPLIFGLPVLISIPYMRKFYLKEVREIKAR